MDSEEELSGLLAGMRFARKRLGGVDETSVWEEIARLDRAYRRILAGREERYRETLSRYEEIIIRQQKQLEEARRRIAKMPDADREEENLWPGQRKRSSDSVWSGGERRMNLRH